MRLFTVHCPCCSEVNEGLDLIKLKGWVTCKKCHFNFGIVGICDRITIVVPEQGKVECQGDQINMDYQRYNHMYCPNCGQRLVGIFVSERKALAHCSRCFCRLESTKQSDYAFIVKAYLGEYDN